MVKRTNNGYTAAQKRIRRERGRQCKNDALSLERAYSIVRTAYHDGTFDFLQMDMPHVAAELERIADALRERARTLARER